MLKMQRAGGTGPTSHLILEVGSLVQESRPGVTAIKSHGQESRRSGVTARSHGDQESRPGFTTIRRHSQGSPPVWQTLEASRKVRDSQESRTDGLKGKE